MGAPLSPRAIELRGIQRLLVRTSPVLILVPVFVPALMDLPYIGRAVAVIVSVLLVSTPPVLALSLRRRSLRRPGLLDESDQGVIAGYATSIVLAAGVFAALGVLAGPVAVHWRIASIDDARRAAQLVQTESNVRSVVQLMRESAVAKPRAFPKSLAEFIATHPEAVPLLVPVPAQQDQLNSAIAKRSTDLPDLVDAVSEFDYGGAGVPVTYGEDRRYVVLLGKNVYDERLRIVAWDDGQVNGVERRELEGILAADADQRRRNAVPVTVWRGEPKEGAASR